MSKPTGIYIGETANSNTIEDCWVYQAPTLEQRFSAFKKRLAAMLERQQIHRPSGRGS